MLQLKQKMYFQQNLLLRKEHFGILALMGDGRRYLFKDCYFDLLKFLYKKYSMENYDTTNEKVVFFLEFLLDKKVIGFKKRNVKVRFVENDFVSNDCMSYPRTVYWECTRVCNFKCIHCYSSAGSQLRDGELKMSQIKGMINEMSVMGTEFLSIGGGEPFLFPNIVEVVKYATENYVSVEISTNGSLVTDEMIVNLKNAGLKFIQVSFDAAYENTFLKIRRGGNLSVVSANTKKLSKYFTVSTCMVINKLNYDEIESVIDLSIKLGAKFFRLIPFMEVGRASEMGELQLTKSQLQDVYKMIINKRKKVGDKIFIQLNENLVIPNRKSIEWMPNDHFGCSAGRSTCGIDSFGNVYPCSYMVFDELVCGNIKNDSLSEIWTNSSVFNELRTISLLKGKCSKCEYLDLCRGGCRAAAYLKNHDIQDSDYLCSIK